MATHSSTPAWKIPWMEEPGRLQSTGSLRVRHMITNEDKLPLHRQKYSHFHLDMLEFVFFPSFCCYSLSNVLSRETELALCKHLEEY